MFKKNEMSFQHRNTKGFHHRVWISLRFQTNTNNFHKKKSLR